MALSSSAASSEVQYSKLCHYCQLISDQLIEIKERQVTTDEEYYANNHPEARTSAAWPRPGRKMRAFHHYMIESELKSSADAGCALCARLLEGDRYGEDRKYSDVPLEEMTGFLTFGPSKHQEDEWQVKLRLGWDPGNVRIVYVKAIPRPEVRYSHSSTNTRDGLKLAKVWLEECKTHHSCLERSDATVSMLPTRLLDISTDQVRLCLSEELGPQTNYAALSHCWGAGKYLTLKTENVKQFMDCIPPEALSQTFLDGISIARYLGLQYIWADSLCIVQDDANDWAFESALMCRVYGLSTITIAASGASDGSKGCFFDRSKTWNCLLRGKSESEPLVAYARAALWGRLRMMPLSKRGWVVQERVLPRRTVFFTQKELFWECDERAACENFPDQCPKELYDRDIVIGMKKRPSKLENWDEFVRLYTSSDLTMSKDKLIAIAGIAQAVQEEIKDQYVAGLWRTDIEHQLLWKNLYAGLESSDKGFRQPEYRAPSWSWAAIDGVIDLQRSNTQPLMVKVQEITLQHSPVENPFGVVLSGTLRISCKQLLRGTLRRSPPCVKLDGFPDDHTHIDLDAKNDGSEKYDGLFCKIFILPITISEPWRKDCLLLKVAGEDQVPELNTKTSTKTSKFPSLSLFGRRKGKGKGKGKEKEKEKEKPQSGEQTNLETSRRQYQRIGIVSISTAWWEHEKKAFETGTSYAAGETDYSEILIDENGQRTYLVDLI